MPKNTDKQKLPISALIFCIVGLAAIVLFVSFWDWSDAPGSRTTAEVAGGEWQPRPDEEVYAAYAGSASCRECHAEAFELWSGSHHALAERPVQPAEDRPAFEPSREIHHGTQKSRARVEANQLQLITSGLDGREHVFPMSRVIGVDPLRQFLVPTSGGRWQATELAFDPNRQEWFDVYGDEDRRPGEWGHWTGRGMTWNSMCAACHNTRLRKHYDPAEDIFRTTMVEMGVGCESCHGPLREHVRWQRDRANRGQKDPTLPQFTRDQYLDTCGSCHSRRAELTGDFRPGDLFGDHHALVIPDETDIYYADGQVREEDYEFASFLGSRMYHAGVRCADCHDVHSGKTQWAGDGLCMRCHNGTVPLSPKIDRATHSFHKLGEPGGRCVDCHMPLTVYMQRHPRRDHGFTIPDPLLTRELGIPNACNRCHTDKSVDWSIDAVEKWYGERMNRPTRQRARTVAAARRGEDTAVAPLLELLRNEEIGAWRASAASLLKRWNDQPHVVAALRDATDDTNSLVRAMAARSLEEPAQQPGHPATATLEALLDDPVRQVRVDAAWGLRRTLDLDTDAASDLLRYLGHNLDQPSGLLQQGVLEMDRGDIESAIRRFTRAVSWDPNSAPLRDALAVAYSLQGNQKRAVEELEQACRLAPTEALYQFKLGLALNENGRLLEAVQALQKAVNLAPDYTQAWYNLGLARAAMDEPEKALTALNRAESLQPRSARIPYASATILAQLGRADEARQAVMRALQVEPEFPEATALLRMLPPN